MDDGSGLWYVQLSDGDVHRVTLDQLDEGFQAGHIDASTMVLAAGATQWMALGAIAGIDEDATAVVPPAHTELPAPPVRAVPTPLLESARPVSVDLGELELELIKPSRSRRRWLISILVVVVVGGVAGLGAERSGVGQVWVQGARSGALTVKSWVAGTVQGNPGTQPTSAPTTALPVAPAPAPAPMPAPTAATPAAAAPSSTAPSATAAHAGFAAGSKAQNRAATSKVRAAPKVPAKPAASSDSPPSAPFTTGNKFDPLSSTIP